MTTIQYTIATNTYNTPPKHHVYRRHATLASATARRFVCRVELRHGPCAPLVASIPMSVLLRGLIRQNK